MGVDGDRRNEARVVERHRAPALLVAFGVEGPVQGDPVDPGEELAPSLELGELVIGLEKGVLRDVVGVARLAREMERQRVHARTVLSHQLVEGVGVSTLGSGHELGGFRPASCGFRSLWFPTQ